MSDAILGACGKGDIGIYFRDDEKENEGIDSKKILKFALEVAGKSNLKLNNIDIVVVADKPKLSPSYDTILKFIAGECGISNTDVSVKSKTTEGTLVGKNSIACFTVVLMKEQ